MKATFHFAETDAERDAIYRFRYAIYAEELHLFGDVADHDRRMLYGADDRTARHLYATVDGDIVGVMRLNLGADAPFSDEHIATYSLDRLRHTLDAAQLLVLTRFVVAPAYRGASLSYQMIEEVAKLALEERIEVAVCDCQPHLIRYYQRLGFRSYAAPVYNDPAFGIMVPLAFVCGDLDHLEAIRSPLQDYFAQRACNTPAVDGYAAALGAPSAIDMAGPRVDRHAFADALTEYVPLFDGLETDAIAHLVGHGHVLELAPGDRLIRKSQPAQTVFVLLEGILEVRDTRGIADTLVPGSVAGELSFLLASRRPADVEVGPSGARVLCLDEKTLRTVLAAPSPSALTLLHNLSRSLAHKLAALIEQPAPRLAMG